jgi:hypothetical protein
VKDQHVQLPMTEWEQTSSPKRNVQPEQQPDPPWRTHKAYIQRDGHPLRPALSEAARQCDVLKQNMATAVMRPCTGTMAQMEDNDARTRGQKADMTHYQAGRCATKPRITKRSWHFHSSCRCSTVCCQKREHSESIASVQIPATCPQH